MSRRDRLREKLMASTVIVPGPLETPCYLWTGSTSGNGRGGGYGRVKVDGGTMATHIVGWVIEHGPIPPRKQLDHKCNNRLCWNEEHLQLVTHKKNQRLRAQRAKACIEVKKAA